MRGRNVVALQKLLGETFAGFELRRRLGRAKDLPAAAREFVNHAQRERKFGANNSQIGMDLVGQGHDRIETLQIDWQALGFIGNAAITRSAITPG